MWLVTPRGTFTDNQPLTTVLDGARPRLPFFPTYYMPHATYRSQRLFARQACDLALGVSEILSFGQVLLLPHERKKNRGVLLSPQHNIRLAVDEEEPQNKAIPVRAEGHIAPGGGDGRHQCDDSGHQYTRL